MCVVHHSAEGGLYDVHCSSGRLSVESIRWMGDVVCHRLRGAGGESGGVMGCSL